MSDWILDLCSGLGGASEAFTNNPHWKVIRIENNPELAHIPHTRLLDVEHWLDWLPGLISEMGSRPTVIWASPPCLEFSMAYAAPGPKAARDGRLDWKPNMSIVEACWEIIEFSHPRYFVVENVQGASPWFLPEFGRWKQHIGSFFLWGNFPQINLPSGWTHEKREGDTWSDDPLRANKRALIPLELSEAFLDAVSMQTTLADFI